MNYKNTINLIFLAAFLTFGLAANHRPVQADSERELRDAVASLNSWLGADERARRWRQILALNVLDTQSALGHSANVAALTEVQQRFDQPIDGLDHPVFNRVRRCIEQQLYQMSRTPADVRYALERARNEYRPADAKGLDILRDDAIFAITMLKRFYKKRLTSRPRAELYYLLKPDQFVDFLETAEFELSPARSKSDIEAEIEKVETTIENIKEQVGRLNQQREQIQKWLDDLKDEPRLEGQAPPGPDDGDTTIRNDLANEQSVRTSLASEDNSEFTANERSRSLLAGEIEDYEKKLEDLRTELAEYDDKTRARQQRFRETLGTFNKYLGPYEQLRVLRNDVYFAQAVESVVRLKTAFLSGANPRTKDLYSDRLEKLTAAYETLTLDNDRRSAATVGFLSGWLEGAGQVPDLVASIRAKHSMPNLYLEVSDYLINEIAGKDVSEFRRVNEQILSRLVRGQAFVTGNVSVQFVPDPNQLHAAIDLSGTITSNTFTKSGRITGFAGANGSFNARRDIFANVGGMFACDVYGDLQLDSYFKGVDSSSSLVQRIANKKYWESKYLSESISRKRTKAQLIPDFESQTDEALSQGYERFADINLGQTDTSQLLPYLYFFTTADRLIAVGHRSTRYDLAATTQPQFFSNLAADVHAKIHESMLSNYVSPLLAGKRLTNVEIAQRFAELTGASMARPENEDADDGFSIKFAEARPIQIEFEDNKFAVTITGDEFTRDRQRIRNGLKIRLSFSIQQGPESLLLVPDSQVTVELVDEKQTNIATVPFKNFLKGRLNDVMKAAQGKPIKLPANLIPLDSIADSDTRRLAERFQLVQLRAELGWVYAGWKYSPEHTTHSGLADTPAISFPMMESASTIETAVESDELQVDLNDQLDLLQPDADSN